MKLIPGKLYRTKEDWTAWSLVDVSLPWEDQYRIRRPKQLPGDSIVIFIKEFSLPPGKHGGNVVYRLVTPMGHVRDLVVGTSLKYVDESDYFLEAKCRS